MATLHALTVKPSDSASVHKGVSLRLLTCSAAFAGSQYIRSMTKSDLVYKALTELTPWIYSASNLYILYLAMDNRFRSKYSTTTNVHYARKKEKPKLWILAAYINSRVHMVSGAALHIYGIFNAMQIWKGSPLNAAQIWFHSVMVIVNGLTALPLLKDMPYTNTRMHRLFGTGVVSNILTGTGTLWVWGHVSNNSGLLKVWCSLTLCKCTYRQQPIKKQTLFAQQLRHLMGAICISFGLYNLILSGMELHREGLRACSTENSTKNQQNGCRGNVDFIDQKPSDYIWSLILWLFCRGRPHKVLYDDGDGSDGLRSEPDRPSAAGNACYCVLWICCPVHRHVVHERKDQFQRAARSRKCHFHPRHHFMACFRVFS